MNIWNLSDVRRKNLESVGVDYSLSGCLEYNPQSFDILDIEKVLAVWEGENDGDDWRWVIKVTPECAKKNGGRFVFLQGGCDYTGWDCQSWASSKFSKTAKQAAKLSLGDVPVDEKNHPMNAGLGHMLNILGGNYSENFTQVYNSLMKQLGSAKKKTWRELKDEELGTSDLPKI